MNFFFKQKSKTQIPALQLDRILVVQSLFLKYKIFLFDTNLLFFKTEMEDTNPALQLDWLIQVQFFKSKIFLFATSSLFLDRNKRHQSLYYN